MTYLTTSNPGTKVRNLMVSTIYKIWKSFSPLYQHYGQHVSGYVEVVGYILQHMFLLNSNRAVYYLKNFPLKYDAHLCVLILSLGPVSELYGVHHCPVIRQKRELFLHWNDLTKAYLPRFCFCCWSILPTSPLFSKAMQIPFKPFGELDHNVVLYDGWDIQILYTFLAPISKT